MPNLTMAALAVFVLLTIASRSLQARALRALSPEEKVRLIDGFSGRAAQRYLPLLGLIGALWWLTTATDVPHERVMVGYLGAVVLYALVRGVLIQRRMAALDLPADYRRNFLAAQGIGGASLLVLVLALLPA